MAVDSAKIIEQVHQAVEVRNQQTAVQTASDSAVPAASVSAHMSVPTESSSSPLVENAIIASAAGGTVTFQKMPSGQYILHVQPGIGVALFVGVIVVVIFIVITIGRIVQKMKHTPRIPRMPKKSSTPRVPEEPKHTNTVRRISL
jgi:hypothetical protein